MQFQPGQSGNPTGRPKGSSGGRVQALAALDVMLAKKKNQRALVKALESELLGDPVRFFKTIIMPLLPREAKLSFDHDGAIRWQSLLTTTSREDPKRDGVGEETEADVSGLPAEGSPTSPPLLRSEGFGVESTPSPLAPCRGGKSDD